jgi:hypothetical protein
MATIVTRSGKGSPLTHAEVDSNFTNLNTDKLELSGGTMTGNLSFGDNDKAIFGAGSDLQIYHDGSNSYIDDAGTGNLTIRANQINFDKYTGEAMARFRADGNTELFYDNAAKLSTTSTGVDITGTLTSDGLTVDRENLTDLKTWANSDVGSIDFYQAQNYPISNGFYRSLDINAGAGNAGSIIRLLTQEPSSSSKQRILIDRTGDISFYEDTGTTAKFFWDASTERLGIGTSSPSELISVEGTVLSNSDAPYIALSAGRPTDRYSAIGLNKGGTSNQVGLSFYTTNNLDTPTEKMRIDSSGNVGIGTSSSASGGGIKLNLNGSSGGGIQFTNNNNGGGAIIPLNAGGQTFYTFTGAVGSETYTERMRIDSSGNLIVGATSAVGDIHGQRSDGAMLWLGRTTNSGQTTALLGEIRFGDTAFDSNLAAIQSNLDGSTTSSNLRFYTQATSAASAERMRIDSSGNVGIGTSSPSSFNSAANNLVVGTGASGDDTGITIYTNSNSSAHLLFADGTSGNASYAGYIRYNHPSDFMAFHNNGGNERMRIDSSGNLLVGTTDASQAANTSGNGTVIGASGGLEVSRDSFSVAYFNKTSVADGTVVEIRKQGTTVGSIGASGGVLTVGNANTGGVIFGYNGSHTFIEPSNTSGASTDDLATLGSGTKRFRDLYLSGGVYLGGAGAANKLDDYEEGTFTPVIVGQTTGGTGTYTIQRGGYVKVGQFVTFQIQLGWTAHTGTGNFRISGLPFTSGSVTSVAYGGAFVAYNNGLSYTSGSTLGAYVAGGSNIIPLVQTTSGGVVSGVPMDSYAPELILVGSYIAA